MAHKSKKKRNKQKVIDVMPSFDLNERFLKDFEAIFAYIATREGEPPAIGWLGEAERLALGQANIHVDIYKRSFSRTFESLYGLRGWLPRQAGKFTQQRAVDLAGVHERLKQAFITALRCSHRP